MDPDITQLIHQISKRKPEALAKIMDIYINNVYSLAKSILCHISTEEDIEECVQDTFLDAWIYIDRYNPDRGTFKTWLLILCKYRALNIRRARLNRPQEVELDDQQSSIYLTPDIVWPHSNKANARVRQILTLAFALSDDILHKAVSGRQTHYSSHQYVIFIEYIIVSRGFIIVPHSWK